MTRAFLSLLTTVALVALGSLAVQANVFSKRPEVVGTSVTFHYGTPIVFRLVINGQRLAKRRSTTLGDSGGIRFNGLFHRSYDIELTWIETMSGNAYLAEVSVPVDQLGSFDSRGRHVVLDLIVGANGAYAVETFSSERLQHIANQTEDRITPEMDRPVRLSQGCAAPIARDDPAYDQPASWIDDWSLSQAKEYLDRASASQPDPLASLGCTGKGGS